MTFKRVKSNKADVKTAQVYEHSNNTVQMETEKKMRTQVLVKCQNWMVFGIPSSCYGVSPFVWFVVQAKVKVFATTVNIMDGSFNCSLFIKFIFNECVSFSVATKIDKVIVFLLAKHSRWRLIKSLLIMWYNILLCIESHKYMGILEWFFYIQIGTMWQTFVKILIRIFH